MDVLIVKLDRDVLHDLNIEGDRDALSATARMSQQAVVVTAAASQAFPITRKRETRNEDDVERIDVDDRAVRLRLPDVHLAALQILHAADLPRLKRLMFDLKKAGENALRVQRWQQALHKLRLIFQPAKKRDRGAWSPRGGEMRQMRCDVYTCGMTRDFFHGTQAFAHDLAQRGFVVHGRIASRVNGTRGRWRMRWPTGRSARRTSEQFRFLQQFGHALEQASGSAAIKHAVVKAER